MVSGDWKRVTRPMRKVCGCTKVTELVPRDVPDWTGESAGEALGAYMFGFWKGLGRRAACRDAGCTTKNGVRVTEAGHGGSSEAVIAVADGGDGLTPL